MLSPELHSFVGSAPAKAPVTLPSRSARPAYPTVFTGFFLHFFLPVWDVGLCR